MEFLFSLSVAGYKVLGIPWNIFLALIPCWIVYYMGLSIHRKKWTKFTFLNQFAFILLFVFWFFLFPNTVYLFTISRHLVNLCSDFDRYRVCLEEMWVVLFMFTYALVGLPTFYYALSRMSKVLGKVIHQNVGRYFPIIMIPLASIGIMFGLSDRFNSWDVLLNPLNLFSVTYEYFTNSILFFNFIIISVSLYLIYFGTYYFVWKIANK